VRADSHEGGSTNWVLSQPDGHVGYMRKVRGQGLCHAFLSLNFAVDENAAHALQLGLDDVNSRRVVEGLLAACWANAALSRQEFQAMKRSVVSEDRDLSNAAERQMRVWALGLQNQEQLDERRKLAAISQRVHPYIALSREAGIDAGRIADLVAARLGWKVLDRGLLDHLAEINHWSRIAVESVDERTASWFNETIGHWLDHQTVPQVEFVHGLTKIVMLAAQHESMIFVGRGAQFILPAARGLTVRLVAPREQRVQEFAEQKGCKKREAEKLLEEIDAGRADFIKRYFRRKIADPHLYDLTLNLAQASYDAAAEIIINTCLLRFGQVGT
jgi:hypothetical protein